LAEDCTAIRFSTDQDRGKNIEGKRSSLYIFSYYGNYYRVETVEKSKKAFFHNILSKNLSQFHL